jgi:Arc/MetJ family transcription regulator
MVKRLSRIPRTNVEFPDEVMAAFMQALKGRDHRESLIRSIYGDPRY